MAVVVSQEQNEIQTFQKWGLDIKFHREKMEKQELDKEFKDPENPLLGAYLGREIDRVRRVLSSLDRAKQSSGLRQRRLWLELLLRELEQEKKEWEQCQQ